MEHCNEVDNLSETIQMRISCGGAWSESRGDEESEDRVRFSSAPANGKKTVDNPPETVESQPRYEK